MMALAGQHYWGPTGMGRRPIRPKFPTPEARWLWLPDPEPAPRLQISSPRTPHVLVRADLVFEGP